MVSERLAAQPHHLDLAETISEDVWRQIDRLGHLRGLTIVQVGASGGYSISLKPMMDVRPSFLDGFGISPVESLALMDSLEQYDPQNEAAVLIAETNPIDGLLLSFVTLDFAVR